MPYTNFGAPGLGDSCKYTAQTSVHYITQFMLPELQYHDPSRRAWSLHNHLICSHGHCTVVVHVIYAFVALFLIVCSWSCWHLQWQACIFMSSSDVVIIGFLCSSALGISFVTGLRSLPSWFIANLSPMKFQFSPEITSLDYSWMEPIIVPNIYCSFSMSRWTLNLK